MKKYITFLICVLTCLSLLASCDKKCSHVWDEGVEVDSGTGGYVMEYTCLRCGDKHRETITIIPPQADAPNAENEPFSAYENQVGKDEFQEQYEQAYKNLQPNYTNDFVYTYSNAFTEITESGEDRSSTNERTEYDADSQILLFRYEFKNNDADAPMNESYSWEYRERDGMLQFYDSRTDETETRLLGFDEFWEFAHSRIPFALFPNPYKLFDNATYFLDVNEDGNTVFTIYSGDENDYSLRQIVFTGTEMLYISKRYTKEADYVDISFDIYRVYNEEVALTPHAS